MTIKTRTIPGATLKKFSSGVLVGTSVVGGGSEQIEGGSHNLRLLGKEDVGGPCRLSKTLTLITPTQVNTVSNRGTDIYPTSINHLADAVNPSDISIMANGTTAIARTTPTSPVANASVALGEVAHDGILSVVGVSTWRARTEVLRKNKYSRYGNPYSVSKSDQASEEYLNYVFGWLPLVSDIRNFCYGVKHSHKILMDFKNGSHKNTRVSYEFPVSKTQNYESLGWNTRDFAATPCGTAHGTLSQDRIARTWFRGAFTYHLPVSKLAESKSAQYALYADHILGIQLTPETVWNLAPWSWAVDWFSNVGDVIHNFSNLGKDSLVLKYGYIMYRKEWRSQQLAVTTSAPYYPPGNNIFTRRVELIRLPSQPYFGYSAVGSLSAAQSAILVALGIHLRP